MSLLDDYQAALRGDTWTGHDGRSRRWYPVRVKWPYWSSSTCYWSRIHIARGMGVIIGIPGSGFAGPVRPAMWCQADMAKPVPIGANDGGRDLCERCARLAPR